MEPPWITIARAELERGVVELPGLEHDNHRIVDYFKATTLDVDHDEVPWCSAFVNWCMQQAEFERTRSAAARSWLKWGVPLSGPRVGCVVVYQRGYNPKTGHVNFCTGIIDSETIKAIGGNQGNRVSEHVFKTDVVLGYRWPIGYPLD